MKIHLAANEVGSDPLAERGYTFPEAVRGQNLTRIFLGLPSGFYFVYAYMQARHWELHTLLELATVSAAFWYAIYVLWAQWYSYRCRPSGNAIVPVLMGVADPTFLTIGLIVTGQQSHVLFSIFCVVNLSYGFRFSNRLMLWHAAVSTAFILYIIRLPGWTDYASTGYEWVFYLWAMAIYTRSLINLNHTRRKKAEAVGVQAHLQAQAASALLAKVSHELRTPLTGIVSTAEMMRCGKDDGKAGEYSETILKLSRDLLDEINELLEFSRLEQSATVLDLKPINLRKFIKDLCVGFLPIAHQKSLAFNIDVDQEIHDHVMVDERKLKIMLRNVLGNAFKFTEQGRVALQVALQGTSRTHYAVEFTVTDTGIGIDQEYQSKIFERFYQVSNGSTRRYEGSGLGMSLSQTIAHKMGGEISVESALGHGSKFSFTLNLERREVEVEPVLTPTTGAVELKHEQEHEQTIVPRRVLVVEDNLTNQIAIKSFLRMDGHRVDTAADGAQAMVLLAQGSYDTVFLDYNMPDMDGVDVYNFYCSQVPVELRASVYFLTADASEASREVLLETGCSGVLYKPFTQAELQKAMMESEREQVAKGVVAA